MRQFEAKGVDFRELQSVRRVGVDELPTVPPKCRIGHSRLLGKPRARLIPRVSAVERVSVPCRVEIANVDADRPFEPSKRLCKSSADPSLEQIVAA